jgi:hypothetical protein
MKTQAGSRELIELCETYGAHNYHPLPIVIEASGSGIPKETNTWTCCPRIPR